MSYLLRRLAFYLLAAWASLTLAFVLPRLMPGDPGTALFARFQGRLRPEAIAAMRGVFGLDDGSLLAQYARYFGHMLRGDLGVSISHFPQPVSEVLAGAFGWSLLLGGLSVAFSFALGTLLGVLAAWRRGGWLDSLLPPALTLLGALPYFWLAMLALYLFGFGLGWFPVRHAYGDGLSPGFTLAFAQSVVAHAVLPAATIVAATLGGWLLAMRNTMVGELGEDYLALARARGLPPRRLIFAYAARNALLPNLTAFGMALGFVVSGALLTEIVFSYPGQGYLLVRAVQSLDYPLIQGLYVTITLAVLGANLLLDLVSVVVDPRLGRPRRPA
jgi:peptide/nickel transport system permease protein